MCVAAASSTVNHTCQHLFNAEVFIIFYEEVAWPLGCTVITTQTKIAVLNCEGGHLCSYSARVPTTVN